jgi:tyrosinase
MINEVEKKMLEIDPTVTMPYWQYTHSFAAPEKDIIFEWFGHAGNKDNDYCVTDGAFANNELIILKLIALDANGIQTEQFVFGNHRNITIR